MRSVNYIIFPKEMELKSLFYRDAVILPTLEYISGSSTEKCDLGEQECKT